MADIDFSTHGQELLHGSRYSAAEVARLLGTARQRVSDWRRGASRPDAEARQAIARALGIPSSAWDAAPLRHPGQGSTSNPSKPSAAVQPTAKPLEPADVAAVVDLSDADVDAMGVAGIEATIRRLRAMRGLPPREQVQACVAEGRLHDRLVVLRQRDANARREYLESEEFRVDVALLASAFRASATDIRTRLQRFGVDLPLPQADAENVEADAPETPEDVEELCAELRTAAEFTAAGEPGLAAGHILSLGIDRNADAIAAVVAQRPELASRLLGLLPQEGPDHRVLRGALERRVAVRAVVLLAPDAREAIAALLDVLGHEDLSREIGG